MLPKFYTHGELLFIVLCPITLTLGRQESNQTNQHIHKILVILSNRVNLECYQ